MNTQNTRQGRFSAPLFALLALSAAACGAAPDQGTGAEDPPSTSISISSPSTDTPADPDGGDAGQTGRPADEQPVESSNQSPPGTRGAGGNPPGSVRPDQAPREK